MSTKKVNSDVNFGHWTEAGGVPPALQKQIENNTKNSTANGEEIKKLQDTTTKHDEQITQNKNQAEATKFQVSQIYKFYEQVIPKATQVFTNINFFTQTRAGNNGWRFVNIKGRIDKSGELYAEDFANVPEKVTLANIPPFFQPTQQITIINFPNFNNNANLGLVRSMNLPLKIEMVVTGKTNTKTNINLMGAIPPCTQTVPILQNDEFYTLTFLPVM